MKKTPSNLGIFLLSIGDELLDGRTPNTNATWFAEKLREHGLSVSEVRCVSDRTEDIGGALKAAAAFPVTIVTGGLGPTNDDRTLASAAKALKLPLQFTKASLEHVRSRYLARGLPLTEQRQRLALVLKGSKILSNPTGTAPGLAVKKGKSLFYFLPGPPNECRPIFAEEILPGLAKKMARKKLQERKFWRTFGRGESEVYQRVASLIEPLEKKYPQTFYFGVHITFPCIDLTLESWKIPGQKSPSQEEIKTVSQKIDAALGDIAFTHQREDLVQVVAGLLKEKKSTLALAESCTGGLLAKMFTDLPGSSEYFLGSLVTYHNAWKEKFLAVPKTILQTEGAVSEATVRQMAESLRQQTGADYALALSGISGPGGGSAQKPVGTIYVALSNKAGSKILHQVILSGKGSRDQNRVIATHLALSLLKDALRA